MTFGKAIRNNWLLDEDCIFLNHGSFGAAPIMVLEYFFELTRQMERQPLRFFMDDYEPLYTNALNKISDFVNCTDGGLVFVDNATTGVNTVLRSIDVDLKTGDEIAYLDQVYPAVRNTIHYIAGRTGAIPLEIAIPLPVESDEQVLSILSEKLTDKVKIAIMDHITAPTGIILPVKEIIAMCRDRGIISVIDGAHVPGMINLDIDDLKPDFYTGNCHKWLFSPKGSAILYINEIFRDKIHPLTISLFYGQGLAHEFSWWGTRSPAPWLAVTKAIEFYDSLSRDNIKKYIHNLAVESGKKVRDRLGYAGVCPDNMLGSIVAFELPGVINQADTTSKLRKEMLDRFNIEIPFFNLGEKVFVRFSCQVYNEPVEYDKLCEALRIIL